MLYIESVTVPGCEVGLGKRRDEASAVSSVVEAIKKDTPKPFTLSERVAPMSKSLARIYVVVHESNNLKNFKVDMMIAVVYARKPFLKKQNVD